MNTDFKLGVTIEGDVQPFAKAMKAAQKDVDDFSAKIRGLNVKSSGLGKIGKDFSVIGSNAASAGNILKDVFGGNIAAQAVSTLTSELYAGARAVLDYSAALEQSKIGFETLTGSAQLAQKHIEDLQTFAKTTPFEFAGLVDASQKMQGVGIAADKVIPVLKDVGNALAAAGKGNAEIDRTVLAITQIQAKTRLMAQEVNQLAENGIPAWKILSETLGKTNAEIIKMTENGQISSEIFLEALHNYSQVHFGDAMEKQSRTFKGALSNINDAVMITSATAFEPLYKEISQITVKMADEISGAKNFDEALDKLFDGAGQFVALGAEKLGELAADNFIKGIQGNDIVTRLATQLTIGAGKGLYNALPKPPPQRKNAALSEQDAAEYFKNNQGVKLDDVFADAFKPDPLHALIDNLKSVNQAVINTQSLTDKLKAQEAEAQTKKLDEVIKDLAGQIDFYGDKTQVAVVKQKLLKDGISDFGTVGAKTAILMAQRLDDLKSITEKNRKQFDSLTGSIQDLALKVTFFGDESEVAATKQKFLADGITDLNSGLAKSAIAWAKQLDNLKATKKEHDEYESKVKTFRKDMEGFSDKAFDSFLPDQTELDRFDNWLKTAKVGMSAFREEIESTRDALKWAAAYQSLLEGQERFWGFDNAIQATARDLALGAKELSPLQGKLLDVAHAAKLVQTQFATLAPTTAGTLSSFNTTDETFVDKTEDFLSRYKSETENFNQKISKINASNKDVTPKDDAWDSFFNLKDITAKNHQVKLDQITDNFRNYLKTLNTLGKDADGKIKEIPLFAGDSEVNTAIDQIRNLGATVEKSNLAAGFKEIGKVFSELKIQVGGFDNKDEFQDFNDWLAKPDITRGIDERAKAIGKTADEIKSLARETKLLSQGVDLQQMQWALLGPKPIGGDNLKKKDQDSLLIGSGGKMGKPHSDKPSFGENFKDGLFGGDHLGKIENEADRMKAVYADLGGMAGDTIGGMIEGVGALAESWVLYGDLSGEAVKKMLAQTLASLASEAAVKSIYQLAEGFASLFINPAEAAGHFQAAALYGAVAVGAGVAGRAAAGDSFKNQGKGSAAGSSSAKGSASNSNDSFNPYANSSSSEKTDFVRRSEASFLNPNRATERLEQRINELSDNVGKLAKLSDIVQTSKPGDVLVRGSDQKPGYIAQTNLKQLKGNATLTNQTSRLLNNA